MIPYRVDVRPLLDEIGSSVDITDVLDLGVLRVGDEEFVLREPAAFAVAVTNAGGGIVAHGRITAEVTATCSRCLCTYDDTIEGDVVGFYLMEHDELPEAEDAEEVDAEGAIDIGPALLAALVIEAPFAPLHDADCEGLCASCGADLNEGPCRCAEEPRADHPFASLGSLLPDDTTATQDS